MMRAAVSVRILGAVEVWDGERREELPGGKQLALLAFFLLHAGQAVSSDAVIDALWGEQRSGSRKRLQMAISRLRLVLRPLERRNGPVLRTIGGGYLLSLEACRLDATLFQNGVADGLRALQTRDARRARELLSTALAVWRGPALADVAFEDFAQAEIHRLNELRLVALESRIEADLILGSHHQLIAELDALCLEYPTRERLAGQLMLALYRSGRQADSLDVYQRARLHLVDAFGLQPGPDLRTLQSQILEQSPRLAAYASASRSGCQVGLPATMMSGQGRWLRAGGTRQQMCPRSRCP